MNFVWFDYESSGSRVNTDQVLEGSIVLTDDRFKILEKKELRCRLKHNIVPSIGALLVNNISVETLKNAPLSHYQFVLENHKWFENFSPAYFTGYNIQSFDMEFYRRMLFKNLLPNWYQTNTNGNKIHDLLPHIRVAKLLNRNVVATKLNAKGNDSFRLADIAEVNNFNHGIAHTSIVDCLNTIEVAKRIKDVTPDIWQASLTTAHKRDTEALINKEKVFSTFEYFYSRARCFLNKYLFNHKIYNWAICWDLKQHPKDYLELDYSGLVNALQKAPKPIRTLKQNKNPLILSKDYGLKTDPYSQIGLNDIMERAKLLDENPKFVNSISTILEEQAQSKQDLDQTPLLFEETIYAGGINIPQSDKLNMKKFHEVDLKGKLSLVEKFTQERFSYFAKCILYEEYPKEKLPESIYNEMHRHFAKRLTSLNNEKWETFASFYNELDNQRKKFEEDENKLQILEGYNNYVENMEKRFINA